MSKHHLRPHIVILAMGMALASSVLGCDGRIGEPLAGSDADVPPTADAALPSAVDAVPAQPDATPPVPDAPPQPAACDDIYGMATEYLLCDEGPDTCTFNVRTGGGNCNELCALFNGTCVNAYDNVADPGLECEPVIATGDDCTTNRSTEICVCTRFVL